MPCPRLRFPSGATLAVADLLRVATAHDERGGMGEGEATASWAHTSGREEAGRERASATMGDAACPLTRPCPRPRWPSGRRLQVPLPGLRLSQPSPWPPHLLLPGRPPRPRAGLWPPYPVSAADVDGQRVGRLRNRALSAQTRPSRFSTCSLEAAASVRAGPTQLSAEPRAEPTPSPSTAAVLGYATPSSVTSLGVIYLRLTSAPDAAGAAVTFHLIDVQILRGVAPRGA